LQERLVGELKKAQAKKPAKKIAALQASGAGAGSSSRMQRG